ncbi:tRNA 2-selenouridine(34) synthase MnmH [Sulfitobacter guttiformis]|uniref:tRNA 2-selenouridine synthase n=1 Tax=Sulfitobacter guttiformis TaxID=74349 RepID=A0A420DKA7_9RHOB|nr:tRNA 2-selenouridine(34) synthase MnmH [Sulfitobacter guttiformis]KIN71537.1 Sulfurtransferase [Sulfitobacter guttiformis KCTC 32187]RKE94625.1 tRNA 2-selenouridine synthase [Sulfitobacter guttiformis]
MTPFILNTLSDLRNLGVDTIIDVRAPAEFAEDHLPGAVNMPVLTDEQRAEVGTIYTQVSPFKARKIGGALVAQNTARHLQGPLADKEGGWQPLVYCWRGGQRSGAFATILDQVGWRVQLLKGGYKSYRSQVVAALYDTHLPHRLMLVDGGTGTAKTALLHELAAQGAQILDLEGLAAHRGSLFGRTAEAQPAQKMFESRLAVQLGTLDPHKITFVEAESSKIGERMIPAALWARMADAPRMMISAPIGARSSFLCDAYADLTQDKIEFSALVDRLRPYHSAARITEWQTEVEHGNWQKLAADLITHHYDPRYAKSVARREDAVHHVTLPDLEVGTLARAAKALVSRFS